MLINGRAPSARRTAAAIDARTTNIGNQMTASP
jgi:hypothetical protein